MVLRVFRSTICRPSNFHKPKFCASQMPKTTRPDRPEDEARKEYQKLIDYTFGPPIYEQDSRDLTEKDNQTHLMKNAKENPLATHTILGQEFAQEQEAHTLNPKHQQAQEPGERGPTHNLAKDHFHSVSRRRFGESNSNSSYHHVGCPQYYRQLEAEMYDNFAQKYLKWGSDLDKLDKLLAKEMESLELLSERKASFNAYNKDVGSRGYRIAVRPQTVHHYSPEHYYQGQRWCNYCGQYHPNYITNITSSEDKVKKVTKLHSSSKGYEKQPQNEKQCSELPLNLKPETSSLTGKLDLYENQPPYLIQQAPPVEDKDIYHQMTPIERQQENKQDPSLSTQNNLNTNISEPNAQHQRTEGRLKETIGNQYEQKIETNQTSGQYTASEPRLTVQNLVDAAQPHQQQTSVPPSQVGGAEQRTSSLTQHCVHANVSYAEPKAKVLDVEDIMTSIRLDKNLSLSELLERVRAFNRLQYCKECGVVAWKRCPPSDKPECPPPPDCERRCPPPKSHKPCPPPPKPACPPEKPPCPPPQPTCPKPECPDEPKCPPKPDPCQCPPPCEPPKKCCGSTDLQDPVTASQKYMQALHGLLHLTKLSEGFKQRTASLNVVFTALCPNEILQLNRVKDYEPWVPLPSWPYPMGEEKKKLQCPYHGCPHPKPGPVRPNCPPLPCSGFPKRLTYSATL